MKYYDLHFTEHELVVLIALLSDRIADKIKYIKVDNQYVNIEDIATKIANTLERGF